MRNKVSTRYLQPVRDKTGRPVDEARVPTDGAPGKPGAHHGPPAISRRPTRLAASDAVHYITWQGCTPRPTCDAPPARERPHSAGRWRGSTGPHSPVCPVTSMARPDVTRDWIGIGIGIQGVAFATATAEPMPSSRCRGRVERCRAGGGQQVEGLRLATAVLPLPGRSDCDPASFSPALLVLDDQFATMAVGRLTGTSGHVPCRKEVILLTLSQESLTVVPSSPGAPPPATVYSRSVPKSPGNPTPGYSAEGVVPKSPGSPPPGAPEPEGVPMSPGVTPEILRAAAWGLYR